MGFEELKKNLETKGYKVSCFSGKEAAASYICESISGTKVAFGGSMTLEEMGLYEKLSENNEVIWHWRILQGMTNSQVLAEAKTADIYISSVNGIAKTGEIVNIDGTCNRVASTLYGHRKVYFVAGVNKIADDLEGAIHRARNIAAPLNAKRLNRKTPCAVEAKQCFNCNSPERICRALNVLWDKPTGCEYEVILIDEKLGY